MIIDIVNQLEKEGRLRPLIKAGIVSSKILTYRDAYNEFDIQTRINKVKPCQARENIAGKMGITPMSVFNAVKTMRKNG